MLKLPPGDDADSFAVYFDSQAFVIPPTKIMQATGNMPYEHIHKHSQS